MMMDTSEMEDIFDDIENEYDENDDEFFDDNLDLDSCSDTLNDSGLPGSPTTTSILCKSDQDDIDEYLETSWKQMEMEVEAELSRKKEKPEVNTKLDPVVLAESSTGTSENIISDETTNEKSEDVEKTEKGIADDVFGKWVPDAMLPPDSGFMIKKCASKMAKTYIKTPDGIVFDSRRKVLQEMMTNATYPQYYGYMYQGLLQDGWTVNKCLPDGWLYKYDKNGSDSFLDYSFNLYTTRKKAREKIEDLFGNFSAALKRFDELKREKIAVSSSHEIQDNISLTEPPPQHEDNNEAESLPEGFRLDPSTKTIISPGGNHYNSRVEAFQQMCSQQQSDELRTQMFDKLIFEGFQAHELLAPGWIYRQDENQISFLDFHGTLLNSLSEAKQYFQEIFSTEEYKNFEKFLSTIFRAVPTEEDFTDPGQTVPEGWSLMEAGVMGPEGQQFRSRLEALVMILGTGEREEEAEVMRHCLYYEGWCDDQYLPYMWKYKLDPETGTMMFLTREGGVLGSPGEAVTFIRAHSPPFTPEDVERIEFVSSQQHSGQEVEHGASASLVEAKEERRNTSQRHHYSEDKR